MKQQRAISGLDGLREEYRAAQSELSAAYGRFDRALDPDLVEACVYRISAERARCNYLIRAMRAYREESSWN